MAILCSDLHFQVVACWAAFTIGNWADSQVIADTLKRENIRAVNAANGSKARFQSVSFGELKASYSAADVYALANCIDRQCADLGDAWFKSQARQLLLCIMQLAKSATEQQKLAPSTIWTI